ncbi:MAG: hypothetical protein ACQEQ4_05245 [Fibrobacterota bacterium]
MEKTIIYLSAALIMLSASVYAEDTTDISIADSTVVENSDSTPRPTNIDKDENGNWSKLKSLFL